MMVRGTPDEAVQRAEARAAARSERREALLDAAVALIRREGPFVSMEQIAAECGITKPIVYRHFSDRDGLVEAIADRFVDRLITEVGPYLDSDAPAGELLRATIDAYLHLVETDLHLYRFLTTHAGADRRDILAMLVAERVALAIEQRLVAAGLPTDGARPWAYGLVGMVHFASDWWADERPIPRAALVDHLHTLSWDGLATLDLDGRAVQRSAGPSPVRRRPRGGTPPTTARSPR